MLSDTLGLVRMVVASAITRKRGSGAGKWSKSPVGELFASSSLPQHGIWPPAPSSTSSISRKQTEESISVADMDTHRQREAQWMGILASSLTLSFEALPPSGSGASLSSSTSSSVLGVCNIIQPSVSHRIFIIIIFYPPPAKVRRLLLDGVPSSVRYLVWSFLTDGKGRCVPGVYRQLCARGWGGGARAGERGVEKERVREETERDVRDVVRVLIGDGGDSDRGVGVGKDGDGEGDGEDGERRRVEKERRERERKALSLLQAYLNMVPDVVYERGLTEIVAHLLLLAPEEDAFWIFVSVLDAHLRPYFATGRVVLSPVSSSGSSPSLASHTAASGAETTTTQMEVDAGLLVKALEANRGSVFGSFCRVRFGICNLPPPLSEILVYFCTLYTPCRRAVC
uniref:Rab-GAP TBC domain-containing protein n=2 Tax=Psilocybe cubensis TaxID=181762 RepID=A0A8H8CL13_PSICU